MSKCFWMNKKVQILYSFKIVNKDKEKNQKYHTLSFIIICIGLFLTIVNM